jgi:hypothetical protein
LGPLTLLRRLLFAEAALSPLFTFARALAMSAQAVRSCDSWRCWGAVVARFPSCFVTAVEHLVNTVPASIATPVALPLARRARRDARAPAAAPGCCECDRDDEGNAMRVMVFRLPPV